MSPESGVPTRNPFKNEAFARNPFKNEACARIPLENPKAGETR